MYYIYFNNCRLINKSTSKNTVEKQNLLSYWKVAANGPVCSMWVLMSGCRSFVADQREADTRRHDLWRRAFLSMEMHWHVACSSRVVNDILCQPQRYWLLCCSIESIGMYISAHPPFSYVKICKRSIWEDWQRRKGIILCHLRFNFKNVNAWIKTVFQVSEHVNHLPIIARAEDKPVILAQPEMNLDVGS